MVGLALELVSGVPQANGEIAGSYGVFNLVVAGALARAILYRIPRERKLRVSADAVS